MKKKIISVIFFGLIISCGTGPWIISKKMLLYKLPVLKFDSLNHSNLKMDGVYIEYGDLRQRSNCRDVYVFSKNGYLISSFLEDKFIKDSIDNHLKKISNHKRDVDWYRINNDSLEIEYFCANKNEMITWVYYEKGKIINDSIFNLQDEYGKVRYFKLYKKLNFDFNNKSSYLNKKWYKEGLHESRK